MMNELMNETVLIGSVGLLWVVVLFNLLLTLALVRRSGTQLQLQEHMSQEGLQAGEPAPDFTATTLDGEAVTLATYAGRDVVFLFMSPGCEPCRELVPTFESLAPIARRVGVELLYVSVAEAEETRAHIEEYGIALPAIVAPYEENNLVKDYKIKAAPAFCSIDARSRVRASGHLRGNDANSAWQQMVDSWKTLATAEVEVAVR